MLLISLSANQASFKTVHFRNKVGINLIVAERSKHVADDQGNATNGVGKSLLISIIDFCLGSNARNEFKAHLENWSFTLTFEIGSTLHTVTRFASRQEGVILDGKELKLKAYTDWLQKRLFDLPDGVPQISFRSLIPFFLRSRKDAYSDPTQPVKKSSEISTLMANAFLLGLRIDLVIRKFEIKQETESIKKLVGELKKDPTFKEFVGGKSKKDAGIRIRMLEEEIAEIERKLAAFTVAEDYHEKKLEADAIAHQLIDISNRLIGINHNIASIEASIKRTPDIKRSTIEQVYSDAMSAFKIEALKTLENLEQFYDQLATSREQRLLKRKFELLSEKDVLEKEKKNREQAVNDMLAYLNIHQSLDMFVSLNRELSNKRIEADQFKTKSEFLQRYEERKLLLESQKSAQNIEAEAHVKEAKIALKGLEDLYYTLVRTIYPKAGAGFTVENNTGDTQKRYEIKPTIDSAASDGIGKMSLFCYDLSLLLKGFGHHVDFLCHDGRLLTDTDPAQVAAVFKILDEYVARAGKQYIISLNSFQLEELRPRLGDDYDRIVSENIILTLKDHSVEEKLLGIQANFDHEK